jgi:hypothetical protein
MKRHIFFPILILLAGATLGAGRTDAAEILSHNLSVTLDPKTHSLTGTDTIRFSGNLQALELNRKLTVSEIFLEGKKLSFATDSSGEFSAHTSRIILEEPLRNPKKPLVVRYSGTLFQSTAEAVFSHEKVGKEVSATISDEGIYLSYGSGWFPVGGDNPLCRYRITTVTPPGIETVTNGRRTAHILKDNKLTTTCIPSD